MNHFPVAPTNRRFAKRMRSALTDAELKLWNELRAHRLMGMSFRRQMPIAGYIADFACPAKKLIVELDGSQHGVDASVGKDAVRTQALEHVGWKVVRFWNDDVLKDIDGVCMHIVNVAGLADTDKGSG
jgi:very-short-patch-repair endonuclease